MLMGQAPFETVHFICVYVINGTPVIKAFGKFSCPPVIMADPFSAVQVPVPTTTGVADIVKLPLLHCSIFSPAFAVVGGKSIVTDVVFVRFVEQKLVFIAFTFMVPPEESEFDMRSRSPPSP